MIKCKEGTINKIVYDNTVYNNGKYRFYPTIEDLKNLINMIVNANATTEYVRFTPFYINAKLDRQIEFDEYMFYMECREKCDINILNEFLESCSDKTIKNISKEELINMQKQFVLCEYSNTKKFGESLYAYLNYVYEIIPKLVVELKNEYNIKEDDLLFGFFCFEVHSE